MKHYLAILVPQEANGWSAHMPDFPSCRVASRTADLAKMHIAREASILVDQMRRSGAGRLCRARWRRFAPTNTTDWTCRARS